MLENNTLLLPTGDTIILNSEQIEGIEKIKNWLFNDKKNRYFTLSGYAGTGKTTCIKKIFEFYKRGVVVSAPTHKAKKVISNTTKKRGETLHSLLGLRPDTNLDDFNPNDPKFNPIAIPRITDFNLVIIDEASMINADLFDLIKSMTVGGKTKVLFMGDPAQIPPVGEKESVVFFDNTIEKHHLTKIERQNQKNPLTKIYTKIRNALEELDWDFPRKTNLNEEKEGVIFTINKKEFRASVLEKFNSKEFKEDLDFCRLIAWKNETIRSSNEIIRKHLFNNPTDILIVGDVLMGYRTIMSDNMRFSIIENSADYRVLNVSDVTKNQYGLDGHIVTLEEEINKDKSDIKEIFVINANSHQTLHDYAELHDLYKDVAKQNKKKWKEYYSFRRNSILMKTIDKYRDGQYRSNYDVIVKDLDYAFAITAHKSQGSTYSHAFIIETDINDNWVLKERNQIKYVALTRPKITATILTSKID